MLKNKMLCVLTICKKLLPKIRRWQEHLPSALLPIHRPVPKIENKRNESKMKCLLCAHSSVGKETHHALHCSLHGILFLIIELLDFDGPRLAEAHVGFALPVCVVRALRGWISRNHRGQKKGRKVDQGKASSKQCHSSKVGFILSWFKDSQNVNLEFGVMPELIKAVEELKWELPTAIQAECIPLILGGGDVMAVRRACTLNRSNRRDRQLKRDLVKRARSLFP